MGKGFVICVLGLRVRNKHEHEIALITVDSISQIYRPNTYKHLTLMIPAGCMCLATRTLLSYKVAFDFGFTTTLLREYKLP